MPEDYDKYPEETDRRRFVKGVVGGAALAGVGSASATAINTATNPTGAGGGITEFYAVENTDGPAPRGMPVIPVTLDDEGFLKGIYPKVTEVEEAGKTVTTAQQQLGGILYSIRWFQYCGIQTVPGLQPSSVETQDEYFRYSDSTPPAITWQSEKVSPGDKVHIDDFSNYESWGNEVGQDGLGKPGFATWRSQNVSSENNMPVEIIRSTRIEELAQENEFLNAASEQGFIAHLNKCSHFCCVPSFKGFPGSEKFDAEDRIYCPCHQSVYDPYSIVRKSFVALPRPE